MNRTTKIVSVGVAAVVLVAVAVAVKMIWFPSVNDAWFELNGPKLRKVPAGKVIVRPTHFANSQQKGMLLIAKRWLGRDVTFKEMIAVAYGENPGLVWLPPDAPKNNFDFLVTPLSNPQGQLREAIQKKTGYVAHNENRETDVLALKVLDPTLPGLKVSPADEKRSENFKAGRLYITHEKLGDIIGPLGQIVKMPVVDKSGLNDYYDFSVAMNPRKGPEQFDRNSIDKLLSDWGLRLEPDTASVEMLVVSKAK